MSKQKVIDYVLETPNNTNPAILGQFLDEMGGGEEVSIDSLSITENGTYTAQTGHAYSPVTVDVPSGECPFQIANVTIVYENGEVMFRGLAGGSSTSTAPVTGLMYAYETGYVYNEDLDIEQSVGFEGQIIIVDPIEPPYFEIESSSLNVTGDATVEGEDGFWTVYITGDCTLTVS